MYPSANGAVKESILVKSTGSSRTTNGPTEFYDGAGYEPNWQRLEADIDAAEENVQDPLTESPSDMHSLDTAVGDLIASLLATMQAGWDVDVDRQHEWKTRDGKLRQRESMWGVYIRPGVGIGTGWDADPQEAVRLAVEDLSPEASRELSDYRAKQAPPADAVTAA